MYIYLVRHGQTDGNLTFTPGKMRPKTEPLNETGRVQVTETARYIAAQPQRPKAVISSPYTRTLETAQVISDSLGVPLKQDDRLGEFNAGDWSAVSLEEFNDLYDAVPAAERMMHRPPNGESWHDEGVRMRAVVDQAAKDGFDCVVIVSHQDPLCAMVSHMTNKLPAEWEHSVGFPNGSITEFENSSGEWKVIGEHNPLPVTVCPTPDMAVPPQQDS